MYKIDVKRGFGKVFANLRGNSKSLKEYIVSSLKTTGDSQTSNNGF